jgi:hypothetical protein
MIGSSHPNWDGGKIMRSGGYIGVYRPDHPRADKGGYVLEHLLVAEKALGYPVPLSVEVHHVNEIKTDNAGRNLVICQDKAYHDLLHSRAEAYRQTENPDAHRCWICDCWDTGNLMKAGRSWYHQACQSRYAKERYHAR